MFWFVFFNFYFILFCSVPLYFLSFNSASFSFARFRFVLFHRPARAGDEATAEGSPDAAVIWAARVGSPGRSRRRGRNQLGGRAGGGQRAQGSPFARPRAPGPGSRVPGGRRGPGAAGRPPAPSGGTGPDWLSSPAARAPIGRPAIRGAGGAGAVREAEGRPPGRGGTGGFACGLAGGSWRGLPATCRPRRFLRVPRGRVWV